MSAVAATVLYFLVDVLGIKIIQKEGDSTSKIVKGMLYIIISFVVIVLYVGFFVA